MKGRIKQSIYFYASSNSNRERFINSSVVFSTLCGMGRQCDTLMRQIAMKLSQKRGERYCDVVGFVLRRIRYDLIRTCVIAIRGYKKSTAPAKKIQDL